MPGETTYGYTYSWPDNNGCVKGTEETTTLYPGNWIDRFGDESGYFFGNVFDPYINRSVPYFNEGDPDRHIDNDYENVIGKDKCSNPTNAGIQKRFFHYYKTDGNGKYHIYKVIKEFKVNKCKIAPAFGFPGGGTQYSAVDTSYNVQKLLDEKFIEEVDFLGYIPHFDPVCDEKHDKYFFPEYYCQTHKNEKGCEKYKGGKLKRTKSKSKTKTHKRCKNRKYKTRRYKKN